MTDLLLILAGILTGIYSGLLGLGAGVIAVPSLIYLAGFAQPTAQGSALALMIPLATLGAWIYFQNSRLNVTIVLPIFIGSISGGFIGSNLVNLLPLEMLRIGFALTLIFTAINLLWPRK